MKKILFIGVFILSFINVISAQDNKSPKVQGNKSLFLELGGNGLGFSINFDSRFKKIENGLGFRVGFGILPGLDAKDQGTGFTAFSTPTILTVPFGINHLAGKAPHYFESGIGGTFAYIKGKITYVFLSTDFEGSVLIFVPSVGYRYAKTGKAFQGRIFISPLISSGGAAMWGGISVGFKF